MADKLLFNQNLGNFEFTGSGDKKTATIDQDVLIIPDPLLAADKYYFKVNDTEYVCNYVLDGTSWVTFSYRVENSDAISIRKNKSDGRIELSIRPALVEINLESDNLSLYEKAEEPPVTEGVKKAIVRFANDKACIVTLENDTFSLEEV